MKVSELVDFLLNNELPDCGEEGEVLIEVDGWLHDFTIEQTEEVFDGFDSVTPAGWKLVI